MLDISVKLNDNRVPANIKQRHQRFLLAELIPLEREEKVPINLALVLDKSGSMAGRPIEQVKQAAQNIVGLLSSEDRLTLAVFNDQAEIVVKAEALTNPREIMRRIGRIEASGKTAIDKGMDKALSQMEKLNLQGYTNRAIVLTDGLNEHGNDARCRQLAQRAAEKGIPFSTFGFGLDWSPDLLEEIADAGKGRMVHIESPEEVISTFEEEVKSASMTVAKNVRVCLDVKLAGLELAEINAAYVVKPQIVAVDPIRKSGGWEFPIGDLSFDAPKALLIQLFLPPVDQGTFKYGGAYGLYDLPTGRSFDLKTRSCELMVEGVTPYYASVDPEVRDCVARLKIYLQQRLGEKLAVQGKTSEAATVLQEAAKTALQIGQKELATTLQSGATKLQTGEEISKEERIKTRLQTKTTIQKGGGS